MPALWAQAMPVVAAPFTGSFLSVLVVRLPQGRGMVAGRSACPACGAALRARDLVPVLSFAVLRGRCRDCGGAISPLYPALELGALGLALWSVVTVPGPVVWWSCLLGWALLALATIDLRCWRLPNVLTLPLGAVGLVFAGLMLPGRLGEHVTGAALGFGLIFAANLAYQLWRGRIGLGWGDAKLLAAGGAWVGWAGIGGIVLVAALSALAGVMVLRRRGGVVRADTALPFGPALCLGIWLTWLYGPLTIG